MIRAGARSSPLSRAQVREIQEALPQVELEPVWIETIGDKDQKTSLRTLGKTDFFTREIDEQLLKGTIRIAVHSAKDLPEPLAEGLVLAALTRGVDPRDSLVLRSGLDRLPPRPRIALSSLRREEAIRKLCPDATFLDLRGPIGERLALLDRGEADGVVLAEAALIRLGLTHLNRILLPGETVPLQGKLAIVVRRGDEEMIDLFKKIDHSAEV